ncbi:hypothetical protein BVY02_00990 [bacterium J17]|nr:hypothetical protein BVY02_00990 [bacterium J17]
MNDEDNKSGDYSYRTSRIKDLYEEEHPFADYQVEEEDTVDEAEEAGLRGKLNNLKSLPKRFGSQAIILVIAGGIVLYNNYNWLFPHEEIDPLTYSYQQESKTPGGKSAENTIAPFSQPRPSNFKTKWKNPSLSFKDKYFCRGFQTAASCSKERLIHPLAQEYVRQGKELPQKEYKNSRVIREVITLD